MTSVSVSDLTEYEGALKLGRISIGNRLHPVTVYQPANKMTFCTNCWLIGHTRATCSVRERKCRICLKGMIVKKIDDQGVLNTKNIQLHQVSLRTIDASLMKLIKNVLSPLIDIIPDVHDQIRKQISTALIDLECPSRIHAEQVRMNFNSDYNSSITKSTTLSTNVPDNNKVDASPTSSSNTPTLIEEEEKSAMVHPCS
ncbi:unnamed protein product [Rotaria sp. Silwood1]|nr:unnamed protein product [Rotaria sp. Silwood1]CAF4926140.1 unnamed protein product [Rotaria sp. Silwood1]